MPIAASENLTEVARAKLVKVLGREQGAQVFDQTLRAMRVETLESPDMLHAFAQHLVRSGGIVGAVGAMLGMMAVMRGAHGEETD